MEFNRRSFWGWGYADEVLPADVVARFRGVIEQTFNLEITERPEPSLDEVKLRPPRFPLLDSIASLCTDAKFDRAAHTFGKAYRDVVRALDGRFDDPPDYIAYPENEDDVVALMKFCTDEGIALIPYGGGSSVVGGTEGRGLDSARGVICCDLHRLDKVLHVDPISRTARMQSGMYGPQVEAALKPHGLTLRHYPQSFEFSTLGGWIATRSGGHFATLYTHIDEFVQSLRMVTPGGVIRTRPLPGAGDGPDPNRLVVGSEGIFGIITEATMRLQNIPTHRASTTVRFADTDNAVEAVRRISQSGLHPSNLRLISPLEAFAMGIGDGQAAMVLLGFESHDHPQDAKLERALAIATDLGGKRKNAPSSDSGEERSTDVWKNNFIRAPYLRDRMVRAGMIMETFETATTWDHFEEFHRVVFEKTATAAFEQCGNAIVFWRFTHVYPDGPAVYYTVVAPGRRGEELAQWDAIKRAASDAIIEQGGPITHHHAVGRDHQPWFERQHGPVVLDALRRLKDGFDPAGIMNPGVLLRAPEAKDD
ncbi:MAG: FAD-binding oxidoreductase [Deltaproteobacteria bacterium]|nr:FAD-binding oxidoreductase [Deltaproteobacteria bacterium]MCB9489610.1 FAD-binding oxidoreductase [Deltaproteobacteria bacterium]